jgi:hypothetical protein
MLQVHGMNELIGDLDQVRDDASGQLAGVCAALVEAGADAARRRAPRRTSVLAGSIHTEPVPGGAAVVAGSPRVRYAAAVNYGSPRRHIAAVPFMDAAAQAIETQATPAAEAAVGNLLNQNGFTQ